MMSAESATVSGSSPAGDSAGDSTSGNSLFASVFGWTPSGDLAASPVFSISSAMARSANALHEAVTTFGLPTGY